MKKKAISLCLALVMALALLPGAALAAGSSTMNEEDWAVNQRLLSLKERYPEGAPWTNGNSYSNGSYIGLGCAAFAMVLSDGVFGRAAKWTSRDAFLFSEVRAGDVLRINNDTHSVVVLETYDDHVVIAEGNYNSSIHWGRSLTAEQVTAEDNYLLVRDRTDLLGEIPAELPSFDFRDRDFIIQDGELIYYQGKGGAVTIPDTVSSISRSAFHYFEGSYPYQDITDLYIPASVTNVDDGAFGISGDEWGNILHFTVAADNPAFRTVDGVLYSKDMSVLVAYPARTDGQVTIPEGVKVIGAEAFSHHEGLTGVTFPSTLTEIESSAFAYCRELTRLTFPNSLKVIGSGAFCICQELKQVTFGSGLTTIGEAAFEGCSSLEEVAIPGSVTKIDRQAFFDCDGLRSVVIGSANYQGEAALEIGMYAFQYCDSLTQLLLGNEVAVVGYNSFGSCDLRQVHIPGSVDKIESWAFCNNVNLTSLTLDEGISSMGGSAFYNCAGLTRVVLPASLTQLGNAAFGSCPELTLYGLADSPAAPENVRKWGQYNNEAGHFDYFYTPYQVLDVLPTVPAITSSGIDPDFSGTAKASSQTVMVDGKAMTFDMYALVGQGGDTNYVKLQDMAYLLKNTQAKFSVGWDETTQMITLTSGGDIDPNFVPSTPYSGNQVYERRAGTTTINGTAYQMAAFTLQNGSYTYFKLRDLGMALGFNVGWDKINQRVYIETDQPYTDAN